MGEVLRRTEGIEETNEEKINADRYFRKLLIFGTIADIFKTF